MATSAEGSNIHQLLEDYERAMKATDNPRWAAVKAIWLACEDFWRRKGYQIDPGPLAEYLASLDFGKS